MALGIGGEAAAGLVDRQVLADAGEHVLQLAPVGVMIEHVVDGDQRHAGLPRERARRGEPRAVVAAIEHGGGEPHPARCGVAQAGEDIGLRVCMLSFLFATSRSFAFTTVKSTVDSFSSRR